MKTFAFVTLAAVAAMSLPGCAEDFCDKVDCEGSGGGTTSSASTDAGPGSSTSTSSSEPTSSSGSSGGGDGGASGSSSSSESGGGAGGSGGEGGGGAPPGCVPTDGVRIEDDTCAIFVNGNYSGDSEGTIDEPFSRIGDAIAAALATERPIYVCMADEPYVENLVIAQSLQIVGGFGCDSWAWSLGGRTEWTSEADTVPVTVSGDNADVALQGFEIDGPDAEAVGGSSIGIFVDGGVLSVTGSLVGAHNAQPGSNGTNPNGTGTAGTAGDMGSSGCSTPSTVNGGEGHLLECPDGSISLGGNGGPGTVLGGATSNGQDGASDPEVMTPLVNQGTGQPNGGGCDAGDVGGSGAAGSAGLGGEVGSLASGATYVGSAGGVGLTRGLPGQGGGGGGGGRGASQCAATTNAGPSGSGGASGGCGGAPGPGGTPGGASIAIAVFEGELTLVDVELSTDDAGRGGDGASGQPGGAGGQTSGSVGGACGGGPGGIGGRGGAGGGASGGPSAGIVWQGEGGPDLDNVGMNIGERGVKGSGGNGGPDNIGGDGLDGERCAVLTYTGGEPGCTDPE